MRFALRVHQSTQSRRTLWEGSPGHLPTRGTGSVLRDPNRQAARMAVPGPHHLGRTLLRSAWERAASCPQDPRVAKHEAHFGGRYFALLRGWSACARRVGPRGRSHPRGGRPPRRRGASRRSYQGLGQLPFGGPAHGPVAPKQRHRAKWGGEPGDSRPTARVARFATGTVPVGGRHSTETRTGSDTASIPTGPLASSSRGTNTASNW